MTLEPYTPRRLDELAMRLFDAAASVRQLSVRALSEGIDALDLHDKKTLEFLTRIEDWIHRAEANLQFAARRAQGARRAKAAVQQADGTSSAPI